MKHFESVTLFARARDEYVGAGIEISSLSRHDSYRFSINTHLRFLHNELSINLVNIPHPFPSAVTGQDICQTKSC